MALRPNADTIDDEYVTMEHCKEKHDAQKLLQQTVIGLLTAVMVGLITVIGYSYTAKSTADAVSQHLEETNRNAIRFEKTTQDRMDETFKRVEVSQKEIRDDVRVTRDAVQEIKVQMAKGSK